MLFRRKIGPHCKLEFIRNNEKEKLLDSAVVCDYVPDHILEFFKDYV